MMKNLLQDAGCVQADAKFVRKKTMLLMVSCGRLIVMIISSCKLERMVVKYSKMVVRRVWRSCSAGSLASAVGLWW